LGLLHPNYVGLDTGERVHESVDFGSILKSFPARLRQPRPYFLFFGLASAIAATPPGATGPRSRRMVTSRHIPRPANSADHDDHIKEETPAPFLQMDFDTTFDA